MSTKFGHHPWTVEELVSGIDKGTIRLPDIQRPFVWPNAKVRDLIDSMYRGYPVGELMFWANKDGDEQCDLLRCQLVRDVAPSGYGWAAYDTETPAPTVAFGRSLSA